MEVDETQERLVAKWTPTTAISGVDQTIGFVRPKVAAIGDFQLYAR